MATDKNEKNEKYKLWTLPDNKSVISLLSDKITDTALERRRMVGVEDGFG